MQIFVRTLSGKTITLKSSDTVASAKRKIQVKDGLPVDRQSLVYNGRELEDEQSLSDCHIVQASTLHLYFRLSTGEGMRVRVRRPSGELVSVVVGRQDTVLALKSVLEEELGVPLEQQRLFFRGQPLDNQVSLSQYGVQDKSEVGLVVMIPITVKTLTGQAFFLQVATNESVNEVKARIATITGLPREQQRLLYGGMPMNDNSSLDAYEVSCGDEIYSIRRLRLYDIKVRRNKTKGHAIRLKIDASCTVKKLKKMIEAKEGTPSSAAAADSLRS